METLLNVFAVVVLTLIVLGGIAISVGIIAATVMIFKIWRDL